MIEHLRYFAARHKLTVVAENALAGAEGDQERALSLLQARTMRKGESGRLLRRAARIVALRDALDRARAID